jgi:uncharacterized protein (DUF1684 family)
MTVQANQEGTGTFAADWEEWHRNVEARLAAPHGFLAITGLHWLAQAPQSYPDAPGRWWTGEDGPTVRLGHAEELVMEGHPVRNEHRFGIIPERGSIMVVWGDAVLEVAKRGGHDILRPRHPNNPLRLAYRGTPAYAPHPRWRVTGRFVRFEQPRPTTVGAAVEGLEHVYHAVGSIAFELDDHALSLTAFPGHKPGGLLVLFTDETSGTTTYSDVRSLSVDPPESDGSVTLDFNRAINLPCAYTDLATCPLPPRENRLPVAIEAGEKIPYERAD